jgi:hypothetical protein
MIIGITKSPRANKRFRVSIKKSDGKIQTVDFGYLGANTFIDNATENQRENYLKRHMANATEKRLIENLVISPALMSARILWGSSRDIATNIASLNREWGH